jgi:hypothetical protein
MSTEKRDKLNSLIAEICGPDQMSKAEALEFLETLGADIDGMIEALRNEIADGDDSA